MAMQLAQVNFSRLRAPLDAPRLRDFVAALEPVNAVADTAPGFVWRLQTEDGDATAIRAFDWDAGDSAGVIVNMSTWTSVSALADFVFSGAHREVLRRRREWFEHVREATSVLWWVPEGHRPTTEEAEQRVRYLRAHGPTPYAFTFRETFPADAVAGTEMRSGSPDWLCPA
ncbi:DUF3291 domain-containing protein [Tamaricihabitans halophyticus]|nr:DUF3291 domain-containing protein [Tamaricihabitans halophyticus]